MTNHVKRTYFIGKVPNLETWWQEHHKRIIANLAQYTSIDTVSPKESTAEPFLRKYLAPLGFSFSHQRYPTAFWDHPQRCPQPVSSLDESSRIMRAFRKGSGGRHMIVNAHVDVVPLQEHFAEGFNSFVTDSAISARGAVDTKGNLVMFAEALRYLIETGHPPKHDLTLDLVFEEEIGGNGALASGLLGSEADCALVLEPTGGEVFRGHRGCVSFEAVFTGYARHMGDVSGPKLNAIDIAANAVLRLRDLETHMNRDSRTDSAFASWDRAIQLNVGEIRGGEWYGSVPHQCIVGGNAGYLPCHGLEATQNYLTALFEQSVSHHDGVTVNIRWPALRNEAYCMDPADSFLMAACQAIGQPNSRAWNVSCDGRHYNRLMGLPTIIFGCGKLSEAHAVGETLLFDELFLGIRQTIKLLTSNLGKED